MLTLSAKIRKILGDKVKNLRKKGIVPAVLYGPKTKNLNLEVETKDFEKVFIEAGESSLIVLSIEGEKEKHLVLIHEVKRHPLTEKVLHIDFYQPLLTEEIEAKVPLVFEGEAPAVKNLAGTLIKNIQEVEVKALPQNLPHEIRVDLSKLKTFEDNILTEDLSLSSGVKIQRDKKEIVAHVLPPKRVEEELEKPVEAKVEEPEKVGEKKEEKTEQLNPNVKIQNSK